MKESQKENGQKTKQSLADFFRQLGLGVSAEEMVAQAKAAGFENASLHRAYSVRSALKKQARVPKYASADTTNRILRARAKTAKKSKFAPIGVSEFVQKQGASLSVSELYERSQAKGLSFSRKQLAGAKRHLLRKHGNENSPPVEASTGEGAAVSADEIEFLRVAVMIGSSRARELLAMLDQKLDRLISSF